MLGEAFCLDLEGVEPTVRGGVVSVPLGRIAQVLPPAGSYRAELRGRAAAAPATVTLSGEALEWDAGAARPVSEICFCD
jgi:hypothetical protein